MSAFEKNCILVLLVALLSLLILGALTKWGYLDVKVGVQFQYENYTQEGEGEEPGICTEIGCDHQQYYLLSVRETEDIAYAQDEPLEEQLDLWLHDHDLL